MTEAKKYMSARKYDIKDALKINSIATEKALESFFSQKSEEGSLSVIKEAQTYSLLNCGKRIRPFLVNEVCRMLGGKEDAAMPFAIAVEMIHTYSLIHDDLPCMDDDDMRRGKPTNHKVFGEANAVLAGDALLTNAFLAAAKNSAVSPSILRRAIELMADCAGDKGMIGGQITDIQGEGKKLRFEELLILHSLKTGKMIELSACLGALAAGYGEDTEEYAKVASYARKIGLAFQVIDDLLDVIGDEITVGKTLASDADNDKTTFLSFFDVEEARKYAQKLTDEAISEVSSIEGSEGLVELASFLMNRNN